MASAPKTGRVLRRLAAGLLALGVIGAIASVVTLLVSALADLNLADNAVDALLWSGYVLGAAAILFVTGRYLGADDD